MVVSTPELVDRGFLESQTLDFEASLTPVQKFRKTYY